MNKYILNLYFFQDKEKFESLVAQGMETLNADSPAEDEVGAPKFGVSMDA